MDQPHGDQIRIVSCPYQQWNGETGVIIGGWIVHAIPILCIRLDRIDLCLICEVHEVEII